MFLLQDSDRESTTYSRSECINLPALRGHRHILWEYILAFPIYKHCQPVSDPSRNLGPHNDWRGTDQTTRNGLHGLTPWQHSLTMLSSMLY